jgi:hypothetical protein
MCVDSGVSWEEIKDLYPHKAWRVVEVLKNMGWKELLVVGEAEDRQSRAPDVQAVRLRRVLLDSSFLQISAGVRHNSRPDCQDG